MDATAAPVITQVLWSAAITALDVASNTPTGGVGTERSAETMKLKRTAAKAFIVVAAATLTRLVLAKASTVAPARAPMARPATRSGGMSRISWIVAATCLVMAAVVIAALAVRFTVALTASAKPG